MNIKKIKLTTALKSNLLDKGKKRGSRTQYYRFILATSLILFSILPVSASVGWISIFNQKLNSHQNVNLGNIVITDIQFSSPVTGHINHNGVLVLDNTVNPSIFLNVSINGIQTPIILGESQTYENLNNLFQITASEFTDPNSILWEYSNYNPSARITINVWQQDETPSLSLTISPEFTSVEHENHKNFNINTDIKNTGTTEITGTFTLEMNKQQIFKSPLTLSSKETQTFQRNIDTPIIYGNYLLNATASIDNIITYYPNKTQKTTTLYFLSNASFQVLTPSPEISIQKIIPSRLYTCINATTTTIISNDGIFDISNVTITDSVPTTFSSTNSNYIWNIPMLKHGTQNTFYEKITPTQEGSYILEPSSTTYSISSQQYINNSTTPITQVIPTGKTCILSPTVTPTIEPTTINTYTPPESSVTPLTVPINTPIITTQPLSTPFTTTTPIPVSIPGLSFALVIFTLFAAYLNGQRK